MHPFAHTELGAAAVHCRVQDFETEDPTPRVSVALEQFYVPQDLYNLTVEFDVIRPPGATLEAD